MAEVKWIKIVTDIFDDEKILLIESMPDRDSIIVIWFKLLCLAGKTNSGGVLLLNDCIPYTDEMLSTIFRRPLNTVRLALQTFEKFGMIVIVNDTITIPKWGKHQSLDQLESKKEYMREYMQDYRKKQREIACKANSKTNSKTNVNSLDIDIDKEEEKDIDIERDTIAGKPQKHKHGEFKHVLLTDSEYQKLIEDFGENVTETYIRKVDEYCEQSGKRYKNYNLAIRNTFMARDGVKRKEETHYAGIDAECCW